VLLLWFVINAVKFTFLFLFRVLIDRIPVMVLYWRLVMIYTVVAWAYGTATYFASCSHFYTLASCKSRTVQFDFFLMHQKYHARAAQV
jgi:hypothetical protein